MNNERCEETGKLCYSFREARRIISVAHRNTCSNIHKRKQIPKRTYYCKHCHTWHLTSKLRYEEHE